MADGSKSAPLTPEGSESTPLIAEYSANEVSEQSNLDVQQHESSTTESGKGNSGSVAATDGGDVNIDKAGSSGDGDDRKELIGEAEVNEAETEVRKAPQGCSQQPIMMVRDLTNAAAHASHDAAISCLRVSCETRDAITEAQDRMDKALREAEGAAENGASVRYRALASRYEAAIELANTRVIQVEAAAESAENVAKAAETAARQIVEETNEDFDVAHMLSAARLAADDAKQAVIVAYKAKYRALKAMKMCWEYPDYGSVRSGRLPTRHPEEARCGGNVNGKKIAWIVATLVLILGISLLAGIVPLTKNPEHQDSLIAVGTLLVALPMCALFFEIFVRIKKKEEKCERKENAVVMECIDDQLDELDNYFKEHNITPVHSDDKQ